jgi:hypothetical protein
MELCVNSPILLHGVVLTWDLVKVKNKDNFTFPPLLNCIAVCAYFVYHVRTWVLKLVRHTLSCVMVGRLTCQIVCCSVWAGAVSSDTWCSSTHQQQRRS